MVSSDVLGIVVPLVGVIEAPVIDEELNGFAGALKLKDDPGAGSAGLAEKPKPRLGDVVEAAFGAVKDAKGEGC